MESFGTDYKENVRQFDKLIRVNESFDIIKKQLNLNDGELTLYFIDGFIKDTVMQKLMMHFLTIKKMPKNTIDFLNTSLPYVETDSTNSLNLLVRSLLSGAAVVLGSTFGECGIIIDARTYPARETAEPQGDKVINGARDGFVETLILDVLYTYFIFSVFIIFTGV